MMKDRLISLAHVGTTSSLVSAAHTKATIMFDWLNGRPFETLGEAIAHKDPNDIGAIISFDVDPATRQSRPDDLLHEFQAYLARKASAKPELNEREAAARVEGVGRGRL